MYRQTCMSNRIECPKTILEFYCISARLFGRNTCVCVLWGGRGLVNHLVMYRQTCMLLSNRIECPKTRMQCTLRLMYLEFFRFFILHFAYDQKHLQLWILFYVVNVFSFFLMRVFPHRKVFLVTAYLLNRMILPFELGCGRNYIIYPSHQHRWTLLLFAFVETMARSLTVLDWFTRRSCYRFPPTSNSWVKCKAVPPWGDHGPVRLTRCRAAQKHWLCYGMPPTSVALGIC